MAHQLAKSLIENKGFLAQKVAKRYMLLIFLESTIPA